MFTKSRTAKLTGLNMYDINSIGTNKKLNAIDVPGGRNKQKNLIPCFLTHIILIPKKIDKLIDNVIIN